MAFMIINIRYTLPGFVNWFSYVSGLLIMKNKTVNTTVNCFLAWIGRGRVSQACGY